MSEERLRTYFEQADDWIFTLDAEGRVSSVNRRVCEVSGYRADELIGDDATRILGEDNEARVAGFIADLIGNGGEDHLELQVQGKDGQAIWLDMKSSVLRKDGEMTGTLHIGRDVTSRKLAEQELLESETLYRSLFENTPVGLCIMDDEGRLLAFNDALLAPGSYARGDVRPLHPFAQLFGCEGEDRGLLEKAKVHGGLRQHPACFRRKDGSRYDALVSLAPVTLRGRPCWQAVVQNVTEQKRAEEAERRQRALAEALRDTATVLNSTLDLDQVLEHILNNVHRVVFHDGANIMLLEDGVARVVRCHGYYEEQGVTDVVMNVRFDVEETANFEQMVRTRRPVLVSDTWAVSSWRPVPPLDWVRSYVGAPICRDGEVLGFLNIDSKTPGFYDEDHAQRLQAFADQVALAVHNARVYQELESYSETLEAAVARRTAELHHAMEKLEAILTNSPDALLLFDPGGVVQQANPAFFELFAFDPAEVQGQFLVSVVGGDDAFESALRAVIDSGHKQRLELTTRLTDGTPVDLDVALAPVWEEENVRGGICSLRDITGLKEVERMKDMFVSNVSHELRTPITSLRLYHDLLTRNPQKAQVYLLRLEQEIERLNTIIEDLLRLSRLDRGKMPVTSTALNLNRVVAEHLQDRLPMADEQGIVLKVSVAADEPWVRIDESLLRQVLDVLLTNALNYTPVGGRVNVDAVSMQGEAGTWAGIRVADTGPGIPPEEQPHLFDRFYRGEIAQELGTPGTGLGLAIAKEIVDQHQGLIEVESAGVAGAGACFTVWLPAQIDASSL